MSPETVDEDARLMLQFQAGDPSAFETLFARYSARLVGFLGRMVPDRGRAEELAQEVFVRVYEARERYQARARFSTWVFGIAHNLALNELDRAYRRRERPLESEHVGATPDGAAGVDEQLDAKRAADRLARAMARLPDRQRAAMSLRSEHGLAYDEIAAALDTSVASVKSLLHRARERLLVELAEPSS